MEERALLWDNIGSELDIKNRQAFQIRLQPFGISDFSSGVPPMLAVPCQKEQEATNSLSVVPRSNYLFEVSLMDEVNLFDDIYLFYEIVLHEEGRDFVS